MFEQLEVWGISVEVVNAVISVAVIVLPLLAAGIVTLLLGAQALPAWRKFVRSLRPFVDQPTDSAIVVLAKELGVTPEWLSEKFTSLIDAAGKEPSPAPVAVTSAAAVMESVITLPTDATSLTLEPPAHLSTSDRSVMKPPELEGSEAKTGEAVK